ncbi:MAG: DUF2997 domain-containing protein [Spirochaetota bacterium]|nr:DUF2997 domain-containing protein [Spirochaetota bacterium]
MTQRHDLNITITKTGKVEISVEGVKGSKCLQITEDIENELGEVIAREKKSEFYQEEKKVGIDTKIKY